jgi:predicted site-specific integrase-resolvase
VPLKGHRIGYVRVSSFDQKPDRQLENVKLDKVFTDKASGVNGNVKVYQLWELKSVPLPGKECFNLVIQKFQSHLLS